MNSSPLVSIITPTYNRESVLPRSINSVIKQKYKNWELIIVDDRSIDNTKELIKKYMEKDKRIKYIVNKHKKGPGGARNQGLELAKGKYIAFLDSDDEWFDNHLKECVEVLESEDVDVCADLWYTDKNGKRYEVGYNFMLDCFRINSKSKKFIMNGLNACKSLIEEMWGVGISTNALVFNSRLIIKTGIFNEDLFSSQDTEFIFRLLNISRICFIDSFNSVVYKGKDNVYNFENKEDIKKTLLHCKNGIRCRKILKKYMIKSWKFDNVNKYLKYMDKAIAGKNWDIGIAYRKKNKAKALYYYIKSMYYHYNPVKWKTIKKLFIPGYYKKNR